MVFHSIMTLFNFPLNSALTPVCHHHASPRAHNRLHASTLKGPSSYPLATRPLVAPPWFQYAKPWSRLDLTNVFFCGAIDWNAVVLSPRPHRHLSTLQTGHE